MRVNMATGHTIWPLEKNLLALVERFQELYYAPDPGPLLISLASYAAYRIKSLRPVWIMIVGGPSTGKTEIINLLKGCAEVHSVSTLTKAGLLSATKAKDRAKDASGGLLTTIGSSGFVCFKDFTSILSMQRDPQLEILGALREIYDGDWNRYVGTDGGRTLSWSGRLGVIAACTSVIDQHRKMMSAMGDRFLYFRMPLMDADQGERMAKRANGDEHASASMAQSVQEFISGIPTALPKRENEEYIDCLCGLAVLVANCRSEVDWNWNRSEIDFVHAPEGSARLATQLNALDIGLQLIGVPRIRRYNLLRKVALCSMPPARLNILNQLIPGPKKADAKEQRGRTVAEITRNIPHSPATIYRTIQELHAMKIIEPTVVGTGTMAGRWVIAEDWLERWFRTPKGSVVSKEAGGVTELPGWQKEDQEDL